MPDPTAFLRIRREKTPYRPVEQRARDWDYIGPAVPDYPMHARQASRCMDCGVPFCQSNFGCPVKNLIPEWNDLTARGHWQEALASLHATNNFPEFTGFLCPAPCESACVLNRDEAPVTIREIELAIIERGFASGWVTPQRPELERPQRVAIVGSGPAGLAAAQQLRRQGYQVTVYDKATRPGGLLRYGIPDFKMGKHLVDRRLEQLTAEGVEFRLGVTIGSDQTVADLRRDYDAVLLAVGAEAARDLPIPGRELAGVHMAMDYLIQQNKALSGEEPASRIDARGKHVIVIGGGDTGSDCIGTARRQGAKSIHEFCWIEKPGEKRPVSTPWPLPTSTLKVSHAHEEGCERLWGVSATSLSGENGQVKKLHGCRWEMRDGKAVPKPGTEFTLEADLVILAIGFVGVPSAFSAAAPALKVQDNGALAADRDLMTATPGVFVAGDARRGASLIVWAIAEGRQAAAAIETYLGAKK